MERLTHGTQLFGDNETQIYYNKLKNYEDLEEQGKLLKLPCTVGDTVYVKMQFGGYAEAEVRDFTYFLTCGFCIVVTSDKFNKQNIPFSEFGKTVFLTKEEANALYHYRKKQTEGNGGVEGIGNAIPRRRMP